MFFRFFSSILVRLSILRKQLKVQPFQQISNLYKPIYILRCPTHRTQAWPPNILTFGDPKLNLHFSNVSLEGETASQNINVYKKPESLGCFIKNKKDKPCVTVQLFGKKSPFQSWKPWGGSKYQILKNPAIWLFGWC